MLAFIPGDAWPLPVGHLLQPSSLPASPFGIFFSLWSSASEINAQSDSGQLIDLTTTYNYTSLPLLWCASGHSPSALWCAIQRLLKPFIIKIREKQFHWQQHKRKTTLLKWWSGVFKLNATDLWFDYNVQRSLCSGPIKAFLQYVW